MAIGALLDAADELYKIVDIVFARLVAGTSNLNCPRFGLPASVRKDLGVLLREAPFLEIIVARDEVIGDEL